MFRILFFSYVLKLLHWYQHCSFWCVWALEGRQLVVHIAVCCGWCCHGNSEKVTASWGYCWVSHSPLYSSFFFEIYINCHLLTTLCTQCRVHRIFLIIGLFVNSWPNWRKKNQCYYLPDYTKASTLHVFLLSLIEYNLLLILL